MVTHNNRLLMFSLIPLLSGVFICGVALYVLLYETSDYAFIAWEEIFYSSLVSYLGIVAVCSFANTAFLFTKKGKAYDFKRNMLYNVAGLSVALVSYGGWYVL